MAAEKIANSLAEVYFYFMATPCAACGRGPLKGGDARRMSADAVPLRVEVVAACASCGRAERMEFTLRHGTGMDPQTRLPTINPGAEPSTLLDVVAWVMLFRVVTHAAASATDKVEARRLGLEAAQCLEEALKFFDPDSDIPPPHAFFSEVSLQRFRQSPQDYSRQRLLALRQKLPSLSRMRARTQPPEERGRRA